jgi:hypothetical protein
MASSDFILLENLTAGMTEPCLLDIKIGWLPYNPLKMERQAWKITESSQGTHGFRMCGFRGFKRNKGNKGTGFFVDKYIGRKVKGPDLPNQLAQFFSNGLALRTPTITSLLTKLRTMQAIIS